MTEQKTKVSALELLGNWFNYDDKVFSDIFIQLFVELNGSFNYRYFNEFHESTLSHGDINSVIKELTGSKKLEYSEPNEGLEESAKVFKYVKQVYKFGTYPNARTWLSLVYHETQVVLPRSLVLGWIAKQRPEQSTKSFAPINDGNLYHATEKPVFNANKRPNAEVGE